MMQSSETVSYTVNIYAEGGSGNLPAVVVSTAFQAGKYMNVAVSVLDENEAKKDWDGVTNEVMKALTEALERGAEYALPVKIEVEEDSEPAA